MNERPRYVINTLATTKLIWNPEIWQVIAGPRRSYLHSLWLGIGWNIMDAPSRLIKIVVGGVRSKNPIMLVLGLLAFVPSTLLMAFFGIAGYLAAVNITPEQRINSQVLKRKMCEQAIKSGATMEVLDLELLAAQIEGKLPEGVSIPGFPPGWHEKL